MHPQRGDMAKQRILVSANLHITSNVGLNLTCCKAIVRTFIGLVPDRGIGIMGILLSGRPSTTIEI